MKSEIKELIHEAGSLDDLDDFIEMCKNTLNSNKQFSINKKSIFIEMLLFCRIIYCNEYLARKLKFTDEFNFEDSKESVLEIIKYLKEFNGPHIMYAILRVILLKYEDELKVYSGGLRIAI